jgi:hypothetical protein
MVLIPKDMEPGDGMNAQSLYGNPLQWADWFPGYSRDDLALLDEFHDPTVKPLAGFVMDFVGGRTRTALLWNEVRDRDGTVMGLPVPADLFETVEWIGLLKSIIDARARERRKLIVMEVGAGWGPWLVHAANAARRVGIVDFHLGDLLQILFEDGWIAKTRSHRDLGSTVRSRILRQ